MQRWMGLDLGSKTIGVALSDPLGLTAQGHSVIRRRSIEHDLQLLNRIIEEYEVGHIVLGLPKNMNNSLGAQGEASIAFAELLREELQLPVTLWDERLSSRAAEQALMASGRSRQQRKQLIDMVAATLILESYLHSLRSVQDEPH